MNIDYVWSNKTTEVSIATYVATYTPTLVSSIDDTFFLRCCFKNTASNEKVMEYPLKTVNWHSFL